MEISAVMIRFKFHPSVECESQASLGLRACVSAVAAALLELPSKVSIETRIRRHDIMAQIAVARLFATREIADGLRMAVDTPLLDRTRDPHSPPPRLRLRGEGAFF
jgi:hypothetical protein